MDHRGAVARVKSAELVLSKIKDMCDNDPVVLTGDFNVDQTHSSYKLLKTSGVLSDSYERADVRYALNGTFNAFSPDRLTNSRIDHTLVTPDMNIDQYGILTDTYRTVLKDADTIKSIFSTRIHIQRL